ncbi:MAG: penicillin-binding protein activator LpoB [Bacteroidetes bacterium]|nr:penicillin-binding protein activator LpoB [Bacteroidota bacterium]MBU1679654.1 penicillin-binding protein activator LpoB [Bacteroidota bacterium]MBU2505837.1 penicillin-binding protein activator LpoB [Bacteroidota bacterium]
MKKVIAIVILVAVGIALLTACGPSKEVTRIDSKEIVDLSGKWNDTDSRFVAEYMVEDVLKRPWLTDFMVAKSKKPVVIVGKIRNKSSEHIPVDIFSKDIERELLNSGKVTFVASKEEREDIREERKDQKDFSSDVTFKQFFKEIGADFFLSGVVNSIQDSRSGDKVVLYQVDLELIDIETNTKVWIGSKEIKKFIGKSEYKM